jgi:peptidoglycan hydrolase-like protein with peptidoglycan-binding domain
MPHPPFDNSKSYSSGDVVTYYGQYWQATRDISPPMFPSIQSGEVPGQSDAWSSMSADAVVNTVLGDVTIPTVATYTDAKTIAAVQSALVKKGYNCGTTGPNGDGVDGEFGPSTKKAILKLQSDAGIPQTGIIDSGVIMALQVTPGVLPPGVTMAGRAAVQAQVALDASTAADHASTPSDVQAAAQQVAQVEQYGPPIPPELKQAVQDAVAKANAAKTPAQVAAAAQDVRAAAQGLHKAVAPSWWKSPAWPGGLARWKVATIGGAGIVGLGTVMVAVLNAGGVHALALGPARIRTQQ